jgi:Immunoglobulin I-set domain
LYRFKDDAELKESDRVRMVSDANCHLLVIAKAQLSDAARYSIRAANIAGEKSTSATLVVNGQSSDYLSSQFATDAGHTQPDAESNPLAYYMRAAERGARTQDGGSMYKIPFSDGVCQYP